MPAMAAEVTVMRPRGFIAQDFPNYILIGDRLVTDLMPGERVTLQVPAQTRSLVVHCPRALGGYEESRIDYDFNANPTAYFVIAPAPDCVRIQPLDARGAAGPMRQTIPRFAGRAVEYQTGGPILRPGAPAAATTPVPASPVAAAPIPAASMDAGPIAAATAAWVEAFNSRDPARIAALYDPEAVLSDSTEPKPRVGAAAIADYYKSAAQRPTQRVALGERSIRAYGDTAIDSGTYNLFEVRDGPASGTAARYTLVYRQRGGKWLIVHHQSAPASR